MLRFRILVFGVAVMMQITRNGKAKTHRRSRACIVSDETEVAGGSEQTACASGVVDASHWGIFFPCHVLSAISHTLSSIPSFSVYHVCGIVASIAS